MLNVLKNTIFRKAIKKSVFEENPPKNSLCIFLPRRQNPLRNGDPLDEKGKPWSSTMCCMVCNMGKRFSGTQ